MPVVVGGTQQRRPGGLPYRPHDRGRWRTRAGISRFSRRVRPGRSGRRRLPELSGRGRTGPRGPGRTRPFRLSRSTCSRALTTVRRERGHRQRGRRRPIIRCVRESTPPKSRNGWPASYDEGMPPTRTRTIDVLPAPPSRWPCPRPTSPHCAKSWTAARSRGSCSWSTPRSDRPARRCPIVSFGEPAVGEFISVKLARRRGAVLPGRALHPGARPAGRHARFRSTPPPRPTTGGGTRPAVQTGQDRGHAAARPTGGGARTRAAAARGDSPDRSTCGGGTHSSHRAPKAAARKPARGGMSVTMRFNGQSLDLREHP